MRADRIVMRRQDRQTLGNRKKRIVRERAMVSQAMELGAKLRCLQIQNSVAGLDYGGSYYVPPTVEADSNSVEGGVEDGAVVDSTVSPVSGSDDSGVVAPDDQDARVNDTCPYPEVFGG